MAYMEMRRINRCAVRHSTSPSVSEVPDGCICCLGDPHLDLPGFGQIVRFGIRCTRSNYRSPSLNILFSTKPTVVQLVICTDGLVRRRKSVVVQRDGLPGGNTDAGCSGW